MITQANDHATFVSLVRHNQARAPDNEHRRTIYMAGTCPRCGTKMRLLGTYYKCPTCHHRMPR